MTKQELALENSAQRIATGLLTIDIGKRTACGKHPVELVKKLKKVRQLHKIFIYEYSKTNSNLSLLQKIVNLITFYLNNYLVKGNLIVSEIELVPIPSRFFQFIITGDGSIAISFLQLTDTPNSYGGHGGKLVRVNSSETGLEFFYSSLSRPQEETLRWSALVNTNEEGRKEVIRPEWVNWNPLLFVDSAIGLLVNIDYTIRPTGGFILKETGNVPLVYDGQIIRAVGFEPYITSPLPEIIVHPLTQSVLTGNDITLVVTTINALTFQWYKNGNLLTGETHSYLTITDFQADDEATYTVKAINGVGEVMSDGAVLTRKVFLNVQKSGTAQRNNCSGEGYTGSVVTYVVQAGTHQSYISQALADAEAQAAVESGKQAYANSNGTCIAPTLYWNTIQSVNATRNNCGENQMGSTVAYVIEANTRSSLVSVEEANAIALADANAGAQAYANANGVCSAVPTFGNVLKQQDFQKNNCQVGEGSMVTYTVNANTYYRNSQIEADNRALQDLMDNGQAYANAQGICNITYYEVTPSYGINGDNSVGACTVGTETEKLYTTRPSGKIEVGDWFYKDGVDGKEVFYTQPFPIGTDLSFYWISYVEDGINIWVKMAYDSGVWPNSGDLVMEKGVCQELVTYWNTEQSATATKQCPQGQTGSEETFVVEANTVSSTISQEDANNQAYMETALGAQAHANSVGTCTATPAPELLYLNSLPEQTGINLTGFAGSFGMRRVLNGNDVSINNTPLQNYFVGLNINRYGVSPYITSFYPQVAITTNPDTSDLLIKFKNGDTILDAIIVFRGATGEYKYKEGNEEYTGTNIDITYEFLPEYFLLSQGTFAISEDSPQDVCINTLGQDGSLYTTREDLIVFIGDWLYEFGSGGIVPYIRPTYEGAPDFYYVSYMQGEDRVWLELQYGTGIPNVQGDVITNKGICGEGGGGGAQCISYTFTPEGGESYSVEYFECGGQFQSFTSSTPTTVCTDGSYSITSGSPSVSMNGPCGEII